MSDIRRLLALVPSYLLERHRLCVLNPSFNASALVAGADADLIIDDLILDIKVTKDPKVWREYFNQLVGYYLLFRSGGIAGLSRQPRVARLGVYLARYGTLATWRLKDIASEGQFTTARRWFVRRAREEYDTSPLTHSHTFKERGDPYQ